MNDFQEQAKNWLRNVVKQNPDKIKAGVEKAGDLIDKQTGGKYAEKVDAVQQKVGGFVDKQNAEDAPGRSEETPSPAGAESSTAPERPEAASESTGTVSGTGASAGTPEAAPGESAETAGTSDGRTGTQGS
ncbi:antitoxin [Kribbella speibonae]|uniref:Antitoxin n=1 Tax=Kribbella speibonae TaxID=1572660 RepID=A0A4R0J1R6_9ACTN|nr:antitoxin [Kribbella speibonae]TCC37948.1 hypothetical protein E0H92_15885 [Kribbella speibonae]